MLRPPPAIVAAGVIAAPLDYDWDTDVSDDILYPAEDRAHRLARACWLCDPRTGYAFAVAVAEWSVWRFHGIVDTADAEQRLETAYAAADDPHVAPLPEPDEPFPETLQDAHGPLKLARMLLSRAQAWHAAGDTSVHAVAFSLALLALHVCGENPALEAWLEDTLRRCHAHRPEPGAVRAFFFPGLGD